jgi:pimeloyl-ACP methyl ester carboxylesterase
MESLAFGKHPPSSTNFRQAQRATARDTRREHTRYRRARNRASRTRYDRAMLFLPLAERAAHLALTRRGVHSRRVATRAGVVHAYDAKGDGPLPAVVLIHGFGASAAPFAPVILRLRRHVRRVLAVDMPGHGLSDVPREALTPTLLFDAATELLDRELAEPALVVGNSLGGAGALRYALARPDRVRALALASPAGGGASEAEFAELLARFRMRTNADARRFLARLYHRAPWYAPLLAGELRRHFAQRQYVSFLDAASVRDLFAPDELRPLGAPVLLLWGRGDRILPRSSLEFYRAHLPGVRVEEPHDWGHCPHLDDPASFADRLVAFAREAG